MIKNALRFFLCLLLLLSLSGCRKEANDEDLDDLFIFESANGESTVLGYSGLETRIVIPSKLGGLPVTTIAENAFRGMTGLEEVVLPDTVRTIDYAFVECPELVSVTLGSRLRSMNGAFRDCTALTTVSGGDHVVSMDEAFLRCTSLTEGYLPASVESCQSAFRGCTALTTVVIEEGVKTLNLTFDGCLSLRSAALPSSVTTTYATFRDCTSLLEVTGCESITSLDMTFKNCSQLTSLTLGAKITHLSDAFTDCTSLKTIVGLPAEVVTYTASFNGCRALTSLVIPAMTDEEALAAYDLSADFKECASLKQLTIYPTLSVREEFCKLFAGCLSLEEITMPDKMAEALLRVDAEYTDTLFEGENKTLENAVKKYKRASSVRLTDHYGKIDGVSYTHIYGGDIDVFDVEEIKEATPVLGFTSFEKSSYWCGYPMGGNRLTETVGIERTFTFFLRTTGKNDGTLPSTLTVNGMPCRTVE